MNRYFAPDFDVRIDGLTLEANVRGSVSDLTVETSVETAGMATFRLHDPNLSFVDSPLFEPGKNVEIDMGYVNALQQVFLGQITAVHPEFPSSGSPSLSITAYDKSHRMRHNSPDRFTFTAMDDASIVARIAIENQLIPMVVPSILPVDPDRAVPQNGSDWALIKQLADRNGYDVYVIGNELHFRPPLPMTSIVTLRRGANLISFSPRLSTSDQSLFNVIRGYDPHIDQAIVSALTAVSLGADLDAIVERLGSAALEQLISMGRRVVRGQKANNFIEAEVLAKIALSRVLDGLYEARGVTIGNPELQAGSFVEIQGVGKRYSGKFRCSKVTHTLNDSGFRTSFEISPRRASSLLKSLRTKIQDEPPPNRQEKINAPIVGKVVSNYDPQHLARVQVSFPDLSDTMRSGWARVVAPMAGADAGAYFVPDIGDEVLVAFENGDIQKPRILGGSWNDMKRPPKESISLTNSVKLIRTKSGHSIKFDDSQGSEQLSISHKNGSKIVFEANGDLTITSGRSISLSATENIAIKAQRIVLKGDGVIATLSNGTMDVS
jgi:phage protein D/phage baseplate assembly protein gpV